MVRQTADNVDFSKSLHIIFSVTRFAPVTLLFYLERKLLCDFRQVRNSSFGLMERNNYKILKEFPLLQFHQIPLQGPVPPRLPQHGLDRHKPLAMSCGTQKHISSTCMYAIHRYIYNVCVWVAVNPQITACISSFSYITELEENYTSSHRASLSFISLILKCPAEWKTFTL